MTMKIELEDYEIEDLQNLEIGECIESCDIYGNDIYIERVNKNHHNAVEIEGKYYTANFFAPTKVIFKHANNIYN